MSPEPTKAESIAVIGASGRSGVALCRALSAAGLAVRPVVRDAGRWAATGLPGAPRLADLRDGPALRAALAGAARVVSCAHARHAPAILAAAPEGAPLVLMGSTRRFSRWRDDHGDGVRRGEAALLESGRPGVILHPTMIYGAEGEDNVQRLAALLRRLPLAPLPGGGAALVQPVHQSDVTRSLLAALRRDWAAPEAVVVAGPAPLHYADFLRAVCRAAGFAPPRVVPLPLAPLLALAPLLRAVPGLPRIRGDELRRLTEDKAFDIGPMRERLGVDPIGLEEGLALTFAWRPGGEGRG
ncbi:NAD(P)-dependent oxidoreductase [Roseomonas nepalensis]|uniref:NAD(P)-dependent oxidoreductase n=1 Tax=Muricoccus nepalensis TaxID=1854500 RepID=A0A502FUD4_9PROT|nr:NmrA family NAD(P)-binding protein [Roseomonas nepalensis]TPG53227.1 NAD(P)-dependent oxidoreductase [Roseomonas nepalensis]